MIPKLFAIGLIVFITTAQATPAGNEEKHPHSIGPDRHELPLADRVRGLTDFMHNLQDQYKRTLAEVQEENRQLKQRIEALEESNKESEIIIEHLQNGKQEKSPAAPMDVCNGSFYSFFARPTVTNEYIIGDTIIFDEVVSNCGNAYNSGTNYFTCPVSGYYSFTVTIATAPDGNDMFRIDGELEIAGSSISKAIAGYSTTFNDNTYYTQQGTIHAVHRCEAGQSVRVKAWADDPARVLGTRHSSFSGYLVVSD